MVEGTASAGTMERCTDGEKMMQELDIGRLAAITATGSDSSWHVMNTGLSAAELKAERRAASDMEIKKMGRWRNVFNSRDYGGIIREDIDRLLDMSDSAGAAYLRESTVSAYFQLLANRDKLLCSRISGRMPSMFLDTSVMTNLRMGVMPQRTARWFKNNDVKKCRLIHFPIVESLHFMYLVVNMEERTIEFYDSFNNKDGEKYAKCARRFLKEVATVRRERWADGEWELKHIQSVQQNNGTNCGVHTCLNADLRSDNLVVNDYTPELGKSFRYVIACALMNKCLTYRVHKRDTVAAYVEGDAADSDLTEADGGSPATEDNAEETYWMDCNLGESESADASDGCVQLAETSEIADELASHSIRTASEVMVMR